MFVFLCNHAQVERGVQNCRFFAERLPRWTLDGAGGTVLVYVGCSEGQHAWLGMSRPESVLLRFQKLQCWGSSTC